MSYALENSVKIEDGKTFIAKERMQDIVDYYDDNVEIVEKEITDTSRWSIHYYIVFKLNGKFYASGYSEGATESQDESPYEYDGDWIEVTEVVPKEVTVTRYVAKEST